MKQRIVKYQKLHVIKAGHIRNYEDWKAVSGQSDVLAEPDKALSQRQPDSEELVAIKEVLAEGGEASLSEKQREVFQLVIREGKSGREAAKILGVTEGAIRKHLKVIASKFKDMLEGMI